MGTSVVYLLLVWGLVTVVLVALLVYRAFLESREDDQIYISRAEEHLAAEQRDIMTKVTRLGAPIKALSIASGVLLVVCAGAWLWSGFSSL
jgi:uncharacterized membrane protein